MFMINCNHDSHCIQPIFMMSCPHQVLLINYLHQMLRMISCHRLTLFIIFQILTIDFLHRTLLTIYLQTSPMIGCLPLHLTLTTGYHPRTLLTSYLQLVPMTNCLHQILFTIFLCLQLHPVITIHRLRPGFLKSYLLLLLPVIDYQQPMLIHHPKQR